MKINVMTDCDNDYISPEEQIQQLAHAQSTPQNDKTYNSIISASNLNTPNMHDTMQFSYFKAQSVNEKFQPNDSQRKIGRNQSQKVIRNVNYAQQQQPPLKGHQQLPIIIDNRLYFHYHSNPKEKQHVMLSNNQQIQRNNSKEEKWINKEEQFLHELSYKQLNLNSKRAESSQSMMLHPIPMQGNQTPKIIHNQDQETRMLQKFLKTFNNKNWNEFANRILENDKHLIVNHLISLIKVIVERNEVTRGSQISNQNLNHQLNTFNTFKNYQWSKLNLELNQNRAPRTIKKIAKMSQQQENAKDMEDRIMTESSIGPFIDQSQPSQLQSLENTIQSNRVLMQSTIGERKFSEATILHPGRINRVFSPQQYDSKLEHESRVKKFKMDQEASQLRTSIGQLNILQTMGSVNILKEFKYPTAMQDIVNYIKDKDLDLYEKLRQTKSLVNQRFDTSQQSKVVQKNQIQKELKFTRMFTMTERQQLIVLKEWLDFMIENYVKPEDPKYARRLQNEQLILIFTLSDLKDQLSIECTERGELVEKILALFFDTFRSYDLCFDKIIQQELDVFKETLKQQTSLKDAYLKQKEKELDKAIDKAQEIEFTLQDKENHITSLVAQRKAQDVRFKVIRNLIDNLVFDYKQKILKIYGKNKEQRLMARDFIFELKELKRFSERDEKDFENDFDHDEEEKIFENLKKKINKCTQTISLFGKPEDQKSRRVMQKRIKTFEDRRMFGSEVIPSTKKKVLKAQNTGSQTNDLNNGDNDGSQSEVDDHEGQEVDEDDYDDQQVMIIQEQDLDNNDEQTEGLIEDVDDGQSVNSSQREDEEPNLEIDSEGNDLNEDNENILNEQELLQAEKEQQYFRIMEEYEPQQILDMIAYYHYMHNREVEEKEIQTDKRFIGSRLDNQGGSSGDMTNNNRSSSNNNSNSLLRKATMTPNTKMIKQLQHHKAATLSPFKDEEDSLVSDDEVQNSNTVKAKNIRPNAVFRSLALQQPSSSILQRQSSKGSIDSPTKLTHLQSTLTVDDILSEVQNLDLNDLDTLLSTDKSYKKKSMQFLQSIISEIKKTKVFKGLVDKGVKDKMREEEKKSKQKEDRISSKKGQQAQSSNNRNKANNELKKKSTSIPKPTQQQIQSKANGIIEEVSSNSSRNESETREAKAPKKSKEKSQPRRRRSSIMKIPLKSSKITDKVKGKEDKGIQVDIIVADQDFERIKASLISNNSNSQKEEQKLQQPFVNISLNQSENNSPQHQKVQAIFGKLGAAIRQRIEAQLMQNGLSLQLRANQNVFGNTQTVPVPFNLGNKRESKRQITSHAMAKFLPLFIEKYNNNDRKFLNVNAMSIKQLIKFLLQFYQDKTMQSKDSRIIKQQFLGEFIYDCLFNKYGIANITEKKLKEILITVKYNQEKNLMVDLFAKFLGIDNVFFTNDDLSFYFRFNRLMVFGDCFQQTIRKEFNFESGNIIFQNSYEVFVSYFQKKVNQKNFIKIQEDLQIKVKPYVVMPPQGSNGSILLASERFFITVILIYKSIKEQIFEHIKLKTTLITEEDIYPQCMQEKALDFDDFQKVITQVNQRQQLDIETIASLFERNRIYLGGQLASQKEDEKRISLEGVISVIFKYDLITI